MWLALFGATAMDAPGVPVKIPVWASVPVWAENSADDRGDDGVLFVFNLTESGSSFVIVTILSRYYYSIMNL